MPTMVSLPHPVTFKHKETLHRIELPPLARFLHTLTSPPQLIKLNEILNRYRTPKSYHRVDVREICSSELPSTNSPEPERPRINGENRPHHDTTDESDGAPIELDDGVTIEEARRSREVKHGNNEPGSPEAIHPLPPSGPTRRIRELRVDLRTLDPAALFTLEKWRREVLKLEDLPFDHPDSIWYRSPTPEPVAKKRGRPSKGRASTSASVQVEEAAVVNFTQASTPNTSVCAAIGQAVAAAVSWADANGANGIEAFDRMVDGPGPGPSDDTNAPDAPEPVPPQSALEDLFGTEDPAQAITPVETAVRPPSSSPDPILVDAYDHDPEKDPDYAPDIPAPARRSGRPREKAKPTASSSKSVFTRVASPVPMLPIKPAIPAAKRAYRKASSPRPMAPIESERPILLDEEELEEPEMVELDDTPLPVAARTPVVEIAQKRRRVSPSPVSVSRLSITPPRQSAGSSSRIPIDIPDSPDVPTPVSPPAAVAAPIPPPAAVAAPVPPPAPAPKRQSAFQPFVREPMRMPTSASGSARPQWLEDLPDLEEPDDTSSRQRGSRSNGSGSERSYRKTARKSNNERTSERERERDDEDDDVSLVEPSEMGIKSRKRKVVSRDDEWADFMF